MENPHEVLTVKNERKKDIHRLRNVLDEFDYIIRSEGEEKAIKRITCDINKASMELAKGNPSKSVSRWASIILIPILVAEQLMRLPPIGMTLEIITILSNISLDVYKRRYKWINLIR